ncbi:hypothetical protein Rs2_00025 [Raphanus sativus]|uniref:Uncharacterized protein LOC108840254 n=1 Tax=Raphanus sativus TaxID=3726 RepID=A0A6J0M879_RAPSA|nr:uncharacterized protein LOC108840254 [Raphanus sativus]KAJ4914475.1 hypothetical protein Rs2_00025 [Raphanus sativus]
MAFSALNQLYLALADKPEQEKITAEEMSVIASCHIKVLWTAGFASGLAGGLGWQVAKKMKMLKLPLTVLPAVAAFTAAWDWSNSTTAVSCLDNILRQDATRMQRELVNVLVKYNRGEAWRWQLMSKHFYPEAVYNDQGEKPQMRWRKRRTFTEIPASYDDDDVDDAKPQRTNNTDASKTKPVLQNASGDSDGEMADEEDALDSVFGGSEPTESVPAAPVNAKASSKAQTRKQKRAQRRQRRKNREEASVNNSTPQYERA